MQRLQVHTAANWRWTRRNGAKHAGRSFQQFCLPRRDLCRMHVMQLRQLHSVFSPLIAAKSTSALKVGLWCAVISRHAPPLLRSTSAAIRQENHLSGCSDSPSHLSRLVNYRRELYRGTFNDPDRRCSPDRTCRSKARRGEKHLKLWHCAFPASMVHHHLNVRQITHYVSFCWIRLQHALYYQQPRTVPHSAAAVAQDMQALLICPIVQNPG
jgi:hypothetical protein